MSPPVRFDTPFCKLQALGNDFVLVDARSLDFNPDRTHIRALGQRRTGIGFDQMLVLRPGDRDTLASIEIFNADGSSAEQCGNGMRAIAAWFDRAGELADPARVMTPAGAVTLACSGTGTFSADLPGPSPLDAAALGLPPPVLPARAVQWQLVSLGNPHLVVSWPGAPTQADLAEVVAALENGPWRGRINIGLMHAGADGTVALRVHERGAGPTPACGSAACAAAWATRQANPAIAPVAVEQPGGTVMVDLALSDGRAVTSGPAVLVFEGKFA